MKRITILLLSILMLSACSSDDESIDDRLLGTWESIKSETYIDGKLSKTTTPKDTGYFSFLVFNSDATGSSNSYRYNKETGQYELRYSLPFKFKTKGTSLILTESEGSSSDQEYYYFYQNNNLVIKIYDGDELSIGYSTKSKLPTIK